MRNVLKKTLFATAAGGVLALGLSAGSAQAFDKSYWQFYLTVDPCIDIRLNLDPSSMTTVELEQLSVGNIVATSTVHDIAVEQPGSKIKTKGKWGHSYVSSGALDAVHELGDLVSSATAVANNISVTADTQAMFTDLSQIARGTGGSLGEVTARSTVRTIRNLTVDSTATAVGNNINLENALANLQDATHVANAVQTNRMDVTALSAVRDVKISNFKNIGGVEGPLVNSVATAVGNNVNISVMKK
ncbi:hypothetical protein [Ferrovibrio sp.]|uniref:hypothetical protein n=1 Tax=Ferrovibrio sp. TaxID=1917215 RepID=UPI0025B9C99F|nr:hypothetical protein [Ferrovibrio sp.]MBX3456653.1 hypothetical protein [Ferrovibrio sp.]